MARGERLLPVARRLLAVAEEALAAVEAADTAVPLRVDVWGHLQTPHSAVLAWARDRPEVAVEVSMRRNLPLALAALQRGELDVAFGNRSSLDQLPDGLRCRLVLHTPLLALINRYGPLGDAATVDHDDLRRHGLWWPMRASSPELGRFVTDYAEALGAPLSTTGANLGVDALLEQIGSDPAMITLVGGDWPITLGDRLRTVALAPTLNYPWSAIWSVDAEPPVLQMLLEACARWPAV